MSSALAAEAPPEITGPAALFYARPEPLTAAEHGDWRLLPGDSAFAAETNTVMLAVSEFAAASRTYPILFAGADQSPVALVGLERSNLFVTDGQWAEDAYIPAYVRRYPFIFYATDEAERFVLGLDTGCDRIVRDGERGVALFDGDQASAMTTQALHFCEAFRRDVEATTAFVGALKDLLIDQRAAVTLESGESFDIDGFQVVDRARFAALDDATVIDWHRKGWLALVHFHLASLDRFQALLNRQQAMSTSAS
ncbi:SapC family protein [soil metagenome]